MRCRLPSLTVSLALPLLFLTAGCTDAATPEPTPEEALYLRFCAVCHGADGRTVPGMASTPHLNSQGLLTVVDDAFLTASIARGRPGENGRDKPGTKMSVYGEEHGGPLSSEEIAQIVRHVRTWQTAPSVELPPYRARGDPDNGRTVYTLCVPCHGQDGWSTTAPSLAGRTLQETASDAFLRHAVLHGRPGTAMPGFRLSEQDLADLIAFVRTLYQPAVRP